MQIINSTTLFALLSALSLSHAAANTPTVTPSPSTATDLTNRIGVMPVTSQTNTWLPQKKHSASTAVSSVNATLEQKKGGAGGGHGGGGHARPGGGGHGSHSGASNLAGAVSSTVGMAAVVVMAHAWL